MPDLEMELKLRGFSARTVETYLYQNKKFQEFCRKKATEVSEGDIKRYLAHLMSDTKMKNSSVSTLQNLHIERFLIFLPDTILNFKSKRVVVWLASSKQRCWINITSNRE